MTASTRKLITGIHAIAILVLSVATITLSGMIDRYRVSGEELLVNNNFGNAFEGWQKTGSGVAAIDGAQQAMQLSSSDGRGIGSVKQVLAGVVPKGQPVLLSAAMKIESVGSGKEVWESARIIFVGIDENDEPMYYVPHALVMRNGTMDWERYSKVFVSFAGTAKQQVEIQLVNVPGSVWVKDLSLRPAAETLEYRIFWVIDVLLWVAVVAWVFVPHLQYIVATRLGWSIALISTGILVGVLMPVGAKHSISEVLEWFFPWFGGESGVFRVGHFLVFSLLSLAALWNARSRRIVLERVWLLILFAVVTETLQLLVNGRSFKVLDIVVDALGIALALMMLSMCAAYGKSGNKKMRLWCGRL